MKYKVVISESAYNEITECISFVSNVSIIAAKELYVEIMAAINSLSEMPERCSTCNRLKNPFGATRKLLIANGRYAALFRINNDKVLINYFLDLRQKKYSKYAIE